MKLSAGTATRAGPGRHRVLGSGVPARPPGRRAVDAIHAMAAGDDAAGDSSAPSSSARLAVAAKISAARSLARKLAEEKQAAVSAVKLQAQQGFDPSVAADLVRSAELEVAEMAKEAARADAAARAARKAAQGAPQVLELQKLKSENEALQAMVMQLAADRKEAERRLTELRQHGPEANGTAAAAAAAASASHASKPAARGGPVPENQLASLAEAANTAGRRIFTSPEEPAAAGATVKVLYNLAAGPLPRDNQAAPALKLGFNKWETISKAPMQRVAALDGQGQWWAAEVPLPALLFRVDFVVEEANSGAVDNNGAKDFQLALAGAPTESEVAEARLQLLEQAESAAQATFAAEEERIYREWMAAAQGAAEEARLAFINSRRAELLEEARAVVEERRGPAIQAPTAAAAHAGVYAWAKPPEAGATALLLYNRAAGPLQSGGSVMVHVGYDGWWMRDKRVLPMRKLSEAEARRARCPAGGERWGVEVPVWNTAAMLDFAFTNDARSVWDNAQGEDFHTPVKGAASGEKLVQLVFQALEAAGSETAARGERVAARRVLQKATVKAAAARRRRELERRFLYTEPLAPRAGQSVRVFYNPERTVLRGRPDVFMRGSFNRWNHKQCFLPIKMTPAVPEAGGLGFLTADVDVPADAHVMDLCFLDSADMHGGFYDSNRGLDYHVAVAGGRGAAEPLRIAHVASEMAPIAKAGGLGDVVTALGRAVQEEGHEVEIVMPKYDCIDYSAVKGLALVKDFFHEDVQVKVWRGEVEGLTTTFLEPCNGLFWVGSIYTDMGRDRHRFAAFCSAALRYLLHDAPARPHVVHAHDWQAAPVLAADRQGMAAAFTIHNLNYGADLIALGMAAADVATTVSPTYAEEIAGHPAIAAHHDKFYGIRNGIDSDIWDPAADPMLPVGYTAEDAAEGKAAAKAELRRRMGLAEGDVPLVGCVTRLTHQKGIHLIKHAAWRAMERGAQFVLLGSAPEPKVQAEFDALAEDLRRQYPDRARLWFAYDEPLSHLIYAGSDVFLVPSIFEPCGLTQMIAMRYGTVPVVRKTGGLADTVFDVDHDKERAEALGLAVNGFSFEGQDSAGMDYALNRALGAWYNEREWWGGLVRRVMEMDWSWSAPAQDYIELYYRALKK